MILKINRRFIGAEEGMTLLEVIDAVDMQIYGKKTIPRLCYHDGLNPYSACRLCAVEVEKNGKTKTETSCDYEITPGISVKTGTKKIIESRKTTLELLLGKAPDSEVIKHLAYKLGVKRNERYTQKGDNFLKDCIDCGLCVRVCEEIVGKSAISMVGRGAERRIATFYNGKSDDCIGCALCAYVCPTGAIKIEEKNEKRIIWGKEFDLIKMNGHMMTTEQEKRIGNFECKKDASFKILIKEDLCKNCELCVVECPQFLFSVGESFNEKGYKSAKWNLPSSGFSCAGCGMCYDMCPESAIDIYTTKKKVIILKDE